MERDQQVQVRMTADEKLTVEKAKDAYGYASLSEFIRAKMLELSRAILK